MRISVCIPTYNQSQYLEQAVGSACRQTVSPFEIIVSDDCSTDDTPLLLRQLEAQIPALKVIRQPYNLGIAANTDSCLRIATGDYVVRLDSDDFLGNKYLERLSAALQLHPGAAYAHAAVREVDRDGNELGLRALYRPKAYLEGDDALKAAAKGYRVAANILMFRRTALAAVGYLSGRPDYVEDYHLSAAFAAAGYGNVYVPEVLAYYRNWVDGKKVRQRRKMMEIMGLRRVFEEVLEPAYLSRGWSVGILKAQRKHFACMHADCLGWDVYTKAERQELKSALEQLSGAARARFFAWFHLNGLHVIPDVYWKAGAYPKAVVKSLLYR